MYILYVFCFPAKFGEKVDYGGFEKNSPRTDQEHRQIAQSLPEQSTSTKRQTLESKNGVWYTELMKLPYFNIISFTVINPMHNLLLGTTKFMMKTVWVETLDNKDLCEIHNYRRNGVSNISG